jgi:hypothetical protein
MTGRGNDSILLFFRVTEWDLGFPEPEGPKAFPLHPHFPITNQNPTTSTYPVYTSSWKDAKLFLYVLLYSSPF